MSNGGASLFVKSSLSAADVSRYEAEGYLLLGRTLTDAGLAAMRGQCMDAWGRAKGEYDPQASWLRNALLPNIHHESEIVRDFYFDGPLVDVAERLIGPNIKGATSQLTFKMRGNTKPFGWHQDNGYGQLDPANALTTLTALDDCDEANGCLYLIPRSHLRGQIDVSDRLNTKAKTELVDLTVQPGQAEEAKAIAMPMKAGESLVFHCWMLHKSQGNLSKDRDRRILFLRYADADAVELYNDRQPRLGRLLRGETRFDAVRAFEAEM